MARRVVVTGMGILSPLGHNVQDTWEAIKAGKSGITRITRFDTTDLAVKIAAEVKNWVPEDHLPKKEIRRQSRYQHLLIAAAQEAIKHANFTVPEDEADRTGVIIGTGIGGMESLVDEHAMLLETKDPRRVTPFGIPMVMANGGSNHVSIMIGSRGPSYVLVSACATGGDCIGQAFDLIRLGRLDQALAGASEAPIIPIGLASFDRTGAVSHHNDDPATACRPFDRTRTGLVFSEGAAVVALEELEHAKARGATIYAELIGYGSTCDGYHMIAPDPEVRGASLAMRQALKDAKLNVSDIHYVNMHGTGTTLNDPVETKAVKTVFGEQAYIIPMSSTKSMTGHGMGATAAMEAIFAILAMNESIAPPTINLNDPDPECDLDYVPLVAREVKMTHVMSNAFGFGGHNCSLIFKKFMD